MARFRQAGGPPGPWGAIVKKQQNASSSNNPPDQGPSTTPRGRGRGRGRGARGIFRGRATTVPPVRRTVVRLGPAINDEEDENAHNETKGPAINSEPSPISSPSPTPSVIEVHPPEPSTSDTSTRPTKRRRLSTNTLVDVRAGESHGQPSVSANPRRSHIMASVSIETMKENLEVCQADKQKLQAQYEGKLGESSCCAFRSLMVLTPALQKLSHHFFQEVSDSQSLLEICMPSVMECFNSIQAPEALKTLMDQKSRLRAACLEHRKGVWALEGETRSSGS